MKGYTPRLRALGTAEGDFHAGFTTVNSRTRGYARRLSLAHPHNPLVFSFVSRFTDDRKSLWTMWKRALPDHLKPEILSVKEAHRGPGLTESGSAEFGEFLSLVRATGRRTRRRLDDLIRAMPGDPAVEDCLAGICECLDNLNAVQEQLTDQESPEMLAEIR